MAAVYKSLAKASGKDEEAGGKQKIRNKVLILSSRGVTFRYAPSSLHLHPRQQDTDRPKATATS